MGFRTSAACSGSGPGSEMRSATLEKTPRDPPLRMQYSLLTPALKEGYLGIASGNTCLPLLRQIKQTGKKSVSCLCRRGIHSRDNPEDRKPDSST